LAQSPDFDPIKCYREGAIGRNAGLAGAQSGVRKFALALMHIGNDCCERATGAEKSRILANFYSLYPCFPPNERAVAFVSKSRGGHLGIGIATKTAQSPP